MELQYVVKSVVCQLRALKTMLLAVCSNNI